MQEFFSSTLQKKERLIFNPNNTFIEQMEYSLPLLVEESNSIKYCLSKKKQ